LKVSYNPNELIEELEKVFQLMYLGFDVPLSLLVTPESPLAGVLNGWFAVGAAQAVGDSAKNKRGRLTEEELGTLLRSIVDGVYDHPPTKELLGRIRRITQGGNKEISKFAYGMGRLTTLATDYISRHLQDKLQSALIQLALESQVHALAEGAKEQGQTKNAGSEQSIVDTILAMEERGIKIRLRTRRPGGSDGKYDFSPLPEFYEKGKEHFRGARRIEKAASSPEEARRDIAVACPEIEPDLIDRMLEKTQYRPSPPRSSLSHLAAEWAGRQCGLPVNREENEYPPAYLLQVLSRKK
jgi:hypothetical protein